MNKNPLFESKPELAKVLEPFLAPVNDELNRLKRVIYDLHTRDRYGESRTVECYSLDDDLGTEDLPGEDRRGKETLPC